MEEKLQQPFPIWRQQSKSAFKKKDSRPPQRACFPPPDSGRLQEASPFSALTLDIVQLRSLLLQLGLERLRLRLQVGQSLVQLYLLCGHFRELRGSHKFPLYGRRSATKRLKAELTADAAVMTSEGEDAPPVYGRGGGGGWWWGLVRILLLLLLPPHRQVQHGAGVCGKRRRW